MSSLRDVHRISNALLPGYTTVATVTMTPSEQRRDDVFDPDGTYIGQVVYVGRRVSNGREFGWRPARQTRAKLTSKVDAVRRLPRFGTDAA